MTFEFENLGPIKKASLELGKLTVICGKNNTGKTYLSYAVWGWLDHLSVSFWEKNIMSLTELDEKLKNRTKFSFKISDIIQKLEKNSLTFSQDELSNIFSSHENYFQKTHFIFKPQNRLFKENKEEILGEISVEIKGDTITIDPTNHFYDNSNNTKLYSILIATTCSEELFGGIPFILTAQREAINLFQVEIDKGRNERIKHFKTTKGNSDFTYLAEPIEENINFVRDFSNISKKIGELLEDEPHIIKYLEQTLNIKYINIEGKLFIEDKKSDRVLPLEMVSTSVRTLSSLYLWIKHEAFKGDLLMIDEPELSLHPENQIKLARLLVKLVNIGVKVWITTHSDYIVKELNNCLMLAKEFPDKEEVMKNLGYEKSDILKEEDLRAYIAKYDETLGGGTIERIATDELGMVKSTFDEAMVQINNSADTLATHISEHYNL